MAFRDQKYASLQGVAKYDIFAHNAIMGRERIHQMTGAAPTGAAPWADRSEENLPRDPQSLYFNAPPDPSHGFHLWSGADALIDNARIIPNPPRSQMHGVANAISGLRSESISTLVGTELTCSSMPQLDLEDPINGRGSTLGIWFPGSNNLATRFS